MADNIVLLVRRLNEQIWKEQEQITGVENVDWKWVEVNQFERWQNYGVLPTLLANPQVRKMTVGACVSVEEFMTFGNNIYHELGSTEHYDNVMSQFAWQAIDFRPELKSAVERCLRGGLKPQIKWEKQQIVQQEEEEEEEK